MSAQLTTLLTVADLECLPADGKRYELIAGELIVSTAPDLIHQRTAGNIYFAIRNYLSENEIGEVLTTPGVIFSEYDAAIPDLVFMSNERREEIAAGKRIQGAPELVIEIVSPGHENRRRDDVLMRQLYEKFGVAEYWVVDPRQRDVDIYRRSEQGLKMFTTFARDEEITTPLLPNFSCLAGKFFQF